METHQTGIGTHRGPPLFVRRLSWVISRKSFVVHRSDVRRSQLDWLIWDIRRSKYGQPMVEEETNCQSGAHEARG